MSLCDMLLLFCTFVKSYSPHIPHAFDNSNNSCIYKGFQTIKKDDILHFFGRFSSKKFSYVNFSIKNLYRYAYYISIFALFSVNFTYNLKLSVIQIILLLHMYTLFQQLISLTNILQNIIIISTYQGGAAI